MSAVLSRALFSRVSRSQVLLNATRSQLRLQLRAYASYPEHTIIGMPALSPTMTQGNLAVWSKKEGDQLSVGDVIAEVETDKAQMDFEFQDDGYLAKILVPEGTKDVPVNRPIAVYVEDEADVAAFKDFKIEDSSKPAEAPVAAAAEETASSEQTKSESVKTEQPKKTATSQDVDSTPRTRIFASPLAKMMALEQGIALKNVTGTGPHGRIVKADIEKYLKEKPSEDATSTATAAKTPKAQAKVAASAAATTTSTLASGSYEDIEVTQMRNIIANRLLESTQSIPSYIVSSNISVTKLMKLRQSLNVSGNGKYKLSINDILMKAISVAAKRVPEANSHWLGSQGVIRKYNNVDISVAVATPTGLITPIVKNTETKGLVSISAEVKELAKRAKINKLLPEEFQGGTICISNMGMNPAVSMFTSIINPPQSTILAVGTIQRIAVEDAGADNGFTFDDQMTITGTFDHRTIDGARAGDFMKELKTVIENPLELLL
ncbi:dihydrolipoyllysine-residue acetyltransferase component of pyruvate dehydrogenase complex, mitochondrial [Monosporozyma unispora]